MGKLIGDLFSGYTYLTDEDDIKTHNIMSDIINNVVEKERQKERNNMKTKDIYALAQGNGFGTLAFGNVELPIRITKIDCDNRPYSISETKIECEVLHVTDYTRRNGKSMMQHRSDLIKNVYFNNPVTVVIWTDGSKTIVKANGDEPYDPEKGLAMAISKKFMGDNETKSNYYDVFKKWLPKPKKNPEPIGKVVSVREEDGGIRFTVDVDSEKWKIWTTYLDTETGEIIGRSVHPVNYTRKASAERRAKQVWGDNPNATWIVSKTNPWETEEK